MNTLKHWLAALAVAATSATVLADEPPKKPELKDVLGEYSADLSMPITPAAVLVGLTPEQVIQPRTRREFEAGLSGLIGNGAKPVGAIEFVPFYIAYGGRLNFSNYRKDFFYRALTKTSLGIATGTRSIDKHDLAATGYSLSSVLLDAADPIYYRRLHKCVDDLQKVTITAVKAADTPASGAGGQTMLVPVSNAAKLKELPRKGSVEEFTGDDYFTTPGLAIGYAKCVDDNLGEARLWNRSRVAIGLVSGSGQEKADAMRSVDFGNTLWLSAQYGFEGFGTLGRLMRGGYVDCNDEACDPPRTPSQLERSGMLTLMARRTVGKSDLDFDTVGEFKRVDSSLYGLRFTFGSDKRSLFLESSMSRDRLEGETRRTRQHAIGASFRYTDNLWINVVSGRRKNFVNDKLDSVVSLGVQWGAEPAPLVKPK